MCTGWVAMKHKAEFPYLAVDLKNNLEKDDSSWLKHLTYGGLTNPSAEWLNEAKGLNKVFEDQHKQQILKGPGVVNNVTKIAMDRVPSVNIKVATCFIKQRTFIRMKFLNECATRKRKSKPSIDDRKKSKKYKKILT